MTVQSQIEHYYSAETSPRGFLYHAVRAFSLPRRAWEHATLFRHFFGQDLTGRFQGTALGPAWVLVHPLFLFVVYFLVFGYGFRQAQQNLVFFATYLFSGIVCFHGIVAATSTAMNAIVSNSNLVKKVAFPCELLPLVPPTVEATVFLIGFMVAGLVGYLGGAATPGWSLLATPVFLAILVTMTTGLGLLLANLNVFARDVRQLYMILTTPWLFLSPNFWMPAQMFGEERAWAETLEIVLNPAYCLLLAERQILGLDDPSLGIRTTLVENLGVAALWALGLLIVGYGTFMTHKHKFADVV